MPASSTQRRTPSGGNEITTPRASSTSALPHRDDAARLPCLATGHPAPAATRAAAVEMLKVPAPSPPVPQVSTASTDSSTRVACAGTDLSGRGLPLHHRVHDLARGRDLQGVTGDDRFECLSHDLLAHRGRR